MRGFSFLELVFVLCISSFCCIYTITYGYSYIYSLQAHLTIDQLQHAINYGRSIAIANQTKVFVHVQDCQHAICVTTPNGHKIFFKTHLPYKSRLILRQSGFKHDKLIINTKGTTGTNGSFQLDCPTFGDFPQFKLYFNKELRLYRS